MRDDPTAILTARQLTIGYAPGPRAHPIAGPLDLSLRAGEFVCLLGPNGTGKSTLLRTLGAMQPSLEGSLELDGRDIREIPPRERARLISLVLTDTLPPGMMEAYAMVALGRHPYSGWFGGLNAEDHACIRRALDAVGANHLADRQVGELSDGERQRICIARALAQEARIMLLDEPTAFLDLPRRVELMGILRQLAHQQQIALLLSTHDLDLALRFADRLWVLDPSGHLIQGFPESIAMSKAFAAVFQSEHLLWDPARGNFRNPVTPTQLARIHGSGASALWAQRALERLGLGICLEETTAVFSVTIEEGPLWSIKCEGQTHLCEGLSGLIEWVQQRDR